MMAYWNSGMMASEGARVCVPESMGGTADRRPAVDPTALPNTLCFNVPLFQHSDKVHDKVRDKV